MSLSAENKALVERVLGHWWPAFFSYAGETRDNKLNALLNAARSEPLPVSMEGWRLVPAIPSEEMLSAGCDQFRRSREAGNGFCYALGPAYRAMISAAPAPTPGGAQS